MLLRLTVAHMTFPKIILLAFPRKSPNRVAPREKKSVRSRNTPR
jgi:hypothetical protein